MESFMGQFDEQLGNWHHHRVLMSQTFYESKSPIPMPTDLDFDQYSEQQLLAVDQQFFQQLNCGGEKQEANQKTKGKRRKMDNFKEVSKKTEDKSEKKMQKRQCDKRKNFPSFAKKILMDMINVLKKRDKEKESYENKSNRTELLDIMELLKDKQIGKVLGEKLFINREFRRQIVISKIHVVDQKLEYIKRSSMLLKTFLKRAKTSMHEA